MNTEKILLGHVVFTNHNSEGISTVPIILKKDGSYDFRIDKRRDMFKSEEQAQAFIEKHQPDYKTVLMHREYFYHKTVTP
tara:strand:+ start:1679 stop:1918 length:240 start_codon:yes stop_codon:yes gene_type:complete